MKKSYIKPSTKVVKLNNVKLLTASLPVDPNKSTSTQLSSEFNFDDFDDFDE